MQKFLDVLFTAWQDHSTGIITSVILLGVGWMVGVWRARKRWEKKEFFDRLNVSLNILTDDRQLQIRTLLESHCEDIFLNAAITRDVIKAAKKTKESDSILPLPLKEYWYYLNPLVNEISERFSSGYLRRDAGEPVKTERYLVCLTSETAGSIRQRKIRAMVMRKSVLTNLGEEAPTFESKGHSTRWKTLKQLEAEYKREPKRFIELEICF